MSLEIVPKAIAFFPWVHIDEPIEVGMIRLLPYVRLVKPGNLPLVSQEEIDNVLSAYAIRPGKLITHATLLELSNWYTGIDAADGVVDLFKARNAIAFSALSIRKLFRGHFGYCNYDTYALIVQRFQSNSAGTFAFNTRRRDGGTNQLWSSDEYAFHQPHHVTRDARIALDYPLLKAMLSLGTTHHYLHEAAVEFCCANTDSNDVPEHIEIVMIKSAFEWLLGIGENVNDFSNALLDLIPDIEPPPTSGPMKEVWELCRPRARRPLDAWAREFCALRGASAHGQQRSGRHFAWEPHVHLAFSSLLFPLAFKKLLAREGLFEIDAYDQARLKSIEQYLMHDPFRFDWKERDASHPWSEIDSLARFQGLSL